MAKKTKMPARSERDGQIALERTGDELLLLSCTQDGEAMAVRMSEYNAWRAFGLLALMLKIKLPDSLAEEIKF
jgi:hypothetical protein